MFCRFMFLLLILIETESYAAVVPSPASKSWPPMKSYDIWGQSTRQKTASSRNVTDSIDFIEKIDSGVGDNSIFGIGGSKTRSSRNGKSE